MDTAGVQGRSPIIPSPGTPVPISATDLVVWQTVIAADPNNAGYIHILDNHGNILAKIAATQSFTLPGGDGPINVQNILIDASATGQIAYVCFSL